MIFDFAHFHRVVKLAVRNTDRVLDQTHYPISTARNTAQSTRPIGIGVQGLADVFRMLKYPFDSPEAAEINVMIFECLYHAAWEASADLAEDEGPYERWNDSPASRGLLQYDLWSITPSARYDFSALKERVATTGVRNSVLTAQMPTATTSQITGNNDSVDPYTRSANITFLPALARCSCKPFRFQQ